MSSQALSTVVDEKVLQSVLKENRAVALYTNYTTSSEHKTFMSGSKMMSVSLPRSEWHAHRNYRRNPQMPEYHVHFRQEIQYVIKNLHAYRTQLNSGGDSKDTRLLQSAYKSYQGMMRGLHGHISIEEGYYFPNLSKLSGVDLQHLYEDHKHLGESESRISSLLRLMVENTAKGRDVRMASAVLSCVLRYDTELMNHLGEEEEIVVPLTLSLTDSQARQMH